MRKVYGRSVTSALVMLLASCSDPTRPSDSQLAIAEARWSAQAPSNGNYTMVQRVACFCPAGGDYFRVSVVGGTVASAVTVDQGTPAPTWLFERFKTVTQLFEETRLAARRGTLVEVAFHPTLGFPTTVSLDPVKNAVDDEVVYQTLSVSAGVNP